METIFRAAMNHIRAKEDLKRKTEDYLIASLNAPSVTPSEIRRPIRQRVLVAACTAVFVCAVSVAGAAYYKTPASYLSLDINPSVELGVNAFGKIVSATAYNSDGTTILTGQDIMDADVKSAVHTLVKSAVQKGFVAKDGSTVISVTSETDNSATAAALEDAAAQGADAAVKSEGKTATINKDNVPLENRGEAQKLDITPGKLNLIRKLQALDPSVTISEYKDAKVTDIMKKIKELKTSAETDSEDAKNSSAPTDSEASSGETVSSDLPSSSGTAIDTDSQAEDSETIDEDSPDSNSTDKQDNDSQSDSSDPENEESHTASGNPGSKGKTFSWAQSHSSSSKGTKSSSHISSSLSSQPKDNTDENENE